MRKVRQSLQIDKLYEEGIKGGGIGVAVLDSGIEAHPDFTDRIVAFKDFVNGKKEMYDDEGHGTHVSGIIAGDGVMSGGILRGIAPKANIIALKVLNNKGMGKEEDVIEGIRWIIDNGRRYNIRIVNISFGTFGKSKGSNQKLLESVELLWDLGYVVVVAAGNNGPETSSITTPGDCKKVITVGADNDNIKMIVNGRVKTNYSGRGPTLECVQKPDIVAPGNGIYSCCNLWRRKYFYVAKSGTSMSTPVVSGVLCLLLSENGALTNLQCKKLIKETATDLKMDKNRQGWGRINPERLIPFGKSLKF